MRSESIIPSNNPLNPDEIVVAHAYGIGGSLEHRDALGGMVFVESGQHAGHVLVQQIIADPNFGERLINDAQSYIQNGHCGHNELRELYYRGAPFPEVTARFFSHFVEVYGGGIDVLLDCRTVTNEVGARLARDPNFPHWEIEIFNCYSGENTIVNHRRSLLLHLAHIFRNDSRRDTTTYSDFDADWLKENYLTKKVRFDALKMNPREVETELAQMAESLGIPKTELDATIQGGHREDYFERVRDELLSLGDMQRLARMRRVSLDSHLTKAALPEAREVVEALVKFAGRAVEVNEKMHFFLMRGLNFVHLAAEAQGIGIDDKLQTVKGALGEILPILEMERRTFSFDPFEGARLTTIK